MLRSKRGSVGLEETLGLIIQLVLALVVGIGLMYFVVGVKNNTMLEKNYLSKDLALLINTIYAAPEYVYYKYNVPEVGLLDYDITIASQKVQVVEKVENAFPIYYPFADDLLNNRALKGNANEGYVAFEKSPGTFEIGTTFSKSVNTLSCEEFEFQGIITVDPGHGEVDDGLVNGELKEAEAMYWAFEVLKPKLDEKITVTATRNPEGLNSKNRGEEARKGHKLIISLHLSESDYVKAYVSNVANQNIIALACNALKKTGFEKVSLVKVNPDFLDDESHNAILKSA